ncbi:hypothetical protein PSU4_30960 [Pseudonocardia sulfidoxydans NBRC 16205]|uniref:Uncharacterized protein n=1 Tax=Pseudonocardia sulfidoxydans NBRC 16205 TaxID=1223511 RepID=A0A511DH74_9PSEU|nr:hypothetical protein PSU4_30960 [Pseudonocardia sulfidoxydans NBRC 16205]
MPPPPGDPPVDLLRGQPRLQGLDPGHDPGLRGEHVVETHAAPTPRTPARFHPAQDRSQPQTTGWAAGEQEPARNLTAIPRR